MFTIMFILIIFPYFPHVQKKGVDHIFRAVSPIPLGIPLGMLAISHSLGSQGKVVLLMGKEKLHKTCWWFGT